MTYPPEPPRYPYPPVSGVPVSPYPPTVPQPPHYPGYPPYGPPPVATFQAVHTVQQRRGFTGAHAAVWVAVIVVGGLLLVPLLCCLGPAIIGIGADPTPTVSAGP